MCDGEKTQAEEECTVHIVDSSNSAASVSHVVDHQLSDLDISTRTAPSLPLVRAASGTVDNASGCLQKGDISAFDKGILGPTFITGPTTVFGRSDLTAVPNLTTSLNTSVSSVRTVVSKTTDPDLATTPNLMASLVVALGSKKADVHLNESSKAVLTLNLNLTPCADVTSSSL